MPNLKKVRSPSVTEVWRQTAVDEMTQTDGRRHTHCLSARFNQIKKIRLQSHTELLKCNWLARLHLSPEWHNVTQHDSWNTSDASSPTKITLDDSKWLRWLENILDVKWSKPLKLTYLFCVPFPVSEGHKSKLTNFDWWNRVCGQVDRSILSWCQPEVEAKRV